MIYEVLENTRLMLNDFLSRRISNTGDYVILSGLKKKTDEEFFDGNKNKIHLTFLNIKEERVLNNQIKNRPAFELWFLCSAQYSQENYQEGLRDLGYCLHFFSGNKVVHQSEFFIPIPEMNKLVYTIENLDFQKLNSSWGVLEESYSPSFLIQARLLSMQMGSNPNIQRITSLQ